MPNKKGGKKFKKGKKESSYDRKLLTKNPEENHEYAKITRINGGGRYQLFCFDGTERLGIAAGGIKRKTRFSLNDIILVCLWDFQDTKCSIIHKYERDEVQKLKSQNEFPKNINLNEDNDFNGEEMVNFDYDMPPDKIESSSGSESDSSDEEIDLDTI